MRDWVPLVPAIVRAVHMQLPGAAAAADLSGLEQLLQSSLAVAHAHSCRPPAAAAAAAAVLLQPPHGSAAATAGRSQTRAELVLAAVEALPPPTVPGRGPERTSGGSVKFQKVVEGCGGDPLRAAVCVAAADMAAARPGGGTSGASDAAVAHRFGEARRVAWEVQLHCGLAGKL